MCFNNKKKEFYNLYECPEELQGFWYDVDSIGRHCQFLDRRKLWNWIRNRLVVFSPELTIEAHPCLF